MNCEGENHVEGFPHSKIGIRPGGCGSRGGLKRVISDIRLNGQIDGHVTGGG